MSFQWKPIALVLGAAAVIGAVHQSVVSTAWHVHETSDLYVLPEPEEVVALSLGYRSALVDMLWAHVLVSQGLHNQEKRRFENLTLYLDTINELEPTFADPY